MAAEHFNLFEILTARLTPPSSGETITILSKETLSVKGIHVFIMLSLIYFIKYDSTYRLSSGVLLEKKP